MNSMILRATSRLILPAALVFSVYVLLRGSRFTRSLVGACR